MRWETAWAIETEIGGGVGGGGMLEGKEVEMVVWDRLGRVMYGF